jgi:hypothetical protein
MPTLFPQEKYYVHLTFAHRSLFQDFSFIQQISKMHLEKPKYFANHVIILENPKEN